MEIREAVVEDYKDIQKICQNDLGYDCQEELVKTSLSELDKNRECVFVAVVDDKIAGFIHVEKYKVLYYESMANILGLAVRNECRKQGVGRALLDSAEKWAKDKKITIMRLNSGGTRKEAHSFYQNAGYTNIKEQLRFIKKL